MAVLAPRVNKLYAAGTGGTVSARYCYSVWLRHLAMASRNGLNTSPQDRGGTGSGRFSGYRSGGLVSGCDQYFALDVVEYADLERNVQIFDELVQLFRRQGADP